MRRKKITGNRQAFVERFREAEEQLIPDELDGTEAGRVKSERYSWHYRPSHHAAAGLLTPEDVEMLKQPGRRLLSVGAHPAYYEQVLCLLGVPAENIVVADMDPRILQSKGSMEKIVFDMNGPWPDIGSFDRIIFPESLCIAMSDRIKQAGLPAKSPEDTTFPTDALEAEMLAHILKEALRRLKPGGEIRADGPMSHPNVVAAMSEKLKAEGCDHIVDYWRFFIAVRP